MTQKLFSIFVLLFPACLFGQLVTRNDTTYTGIIQRDCDDKIFTKMQEPPSLKVSTIVFEDSLAAYLRGKMDFRHNHSVRYIFIVTINSNIIDVQKNAGNPENDYAIREGITALAGLWNPAKQNKFPVCAYVTLDIIFKKDKLNIFILR